DKDNNRIEINNFTYNKADQTLSIQASGKFEGTIVVYNNILYIIIIGGAFLLIALFGIIAWSKSRSNYRRKEFINDTAKRIAKKWNKK
ncbi:MAG: hypothetical protein K5765_07990, partial [Clostridia bacterium]|nr:hypothetical protein [Clostridia bacterium]